ETFYAERRIEEASSPAMLAALFGLVFVLWRLNRDRRFGGIRFFLFAVALLPLTVTLSLALLKYLDTWLAFPALFAAIVLVVPGLEVLEIVRVNRDLDDKIGRLSLWDPERNGWISPLDATESEMETRSTHRKQLLATTSRNARWRLQAIDFFNEELVRFLE